MHPRISDILACAGTPAATIRPTELYNEGWMLRLILDWAQHNHVRPNHPLAFLPDARWYSEALLPSPFLARRRDDALAERWTHADGAIGHFNVGGKNKGGLTLRESATQLVVVEAKMSSKLSGTKNARGYDQAARTVACIAETLKRGDIEPSKIERLAFLVAAPRGQIDAGVFGDIVTKESIRQRVQERVDAYRGDRNKWFDRWFIPTLDAIDLDVLSWEALLTGLDSRYRAFYNECLLYNMPRASS